MLTEDPIGIEILNFVDRFVERCIEEIGCEYDDLSDKHKKERVLGWVERACDRYKGEITAKQ